MRKFWSKVDEYLGKITNIIIVVIIIIIIWALIGKQLQGKYMMYEDYYNQKTMHQ